MKVSVEAGGLTFWRYLRIRRFWFLITVIALAVALVIAAIYGSIGGGQYTEWIDSFLAVPVSIATLLVAIGIGIMNTRREWIDSLPWVLSLRIRLVGPESDGNDPGPETVAVFYDIPLAAPANAREWAQQLASKVMTPRILPLALFDVDLTGGVVRADKASYRRMAISYGVRRVPDPKPTDTQASRAQEEPPAPDGTGMEGAKVRPVVKLKDEYSTGGIFTEGTDLQLAFFPRLTERLNLPEVLNQHESLDDVWSKIASSSRIASFGPE